MFNIGFSRNAHLVLVCTGDPVFEDFVTLIETMAQVAGREHWRSVLVDAASVAPTFTAEQRAALGALAGQRLAGLRVALVVPDPSRFTATRSAAAIHGGQLRYFAGLDEATAWLDTADRAA